VLWKISETTKILHKYATFEGVFFNFLRAKKKKKILKKILATTLKNYIKWLLYIYFFEKVEKSRKNMLPLTI
jgi:hypothetical protein